MNVDRIRKAYQRFKPPTNDGLSPHGNQRLSATQENALVALILFQSMSNKAYQMHEFLQVCRDIHKKSPCKFTYPWLEGLLERKKEWVCLRESQLLGPSRSKEDNLSQVLNFIAWHTKFLEDHYFREFSIINADESRVCLKDMGKTGKRLMSAIFGKGGTKGKREKAYISVVPFVSAAGRVICCFYILPLGSMEGTVNIPHRVGYRLRGDFQEYYLFTETGYSNTETFQAMSEKFVEEYHRQHGKVDAILYLDRLASHITPKLNTTLANGGVWCLLFPPGTTHFIQPLDDIAFALFKRLLKYFKDQFLGVECFSVDRNESPLLHAIVPAIHKALSSAVIKKSFDNTGIYPWNPARIAARARIIYPGPEIPLPEIGTTVSEILAALDKSRPPPKSSTVTPHKIHLRRKSQVWTLPEIVAEGERYLKEKARLEEDKAARKEEKRRLREQAALDKEVKRKGREVKRAEAERAKKQKQEEQTYHKTVNTCNYCSKGRRTAGGWDHCPTCGTHALCPRCSKDPLVHIEFKEHRDTCVVPILVTSDPSSLASSKD